MGFSQPPLRGGGWLCITLSNMDEFLSGEIDVLRDNRDKWRSIADTLYSAIVLGAGGEGMDCFEWALYDEGMSGEEVQAYCEKLETS